MRLVARWARELAARAGIVLKTPDAAAQGGRNGGAAASGVSSLTPRERQVLALVAEGLTNPQIGQRLFISPKTASVHVSAILVKIGAANRTEAAALYASDETVLGGARGLARGAGVLVAPPGRSRALAGAGLGIRPMSGTPLTEECRSCQQKPGPPGPPRQETEMNASTHAAHILDNRRAAQLDRENELLRRHAERAAASNSQLAPTVVAAAASESNHRPHGLGPVTGWFAKSVRSAAHRTAH